MEVKKELIDGIKAGLMALRENLVEPMGLSLTAHDGSFGWGFFKFKALPGHPNPGNAGGGWSHPAATEAFKQAHAPRDWPQGGSYPWGYKTTLDEVKQFALEIGRRTGFGTDFELECAWKSDGDMTVPGTEGTLSDMNLLRGGAEHYAYYPDAKEDISYVKPDGSGEPVDPELEERIKDKARGLKKKEKAGTDQYMTPPENAEPVTISSAWYIDEAPGEIVAETVPGELFSFAISPFRAVGDDDLQQYSGDHPRKLHGVPVPAVLYPYYGLEKSEETLSAMLRVRLAPSELERLKAVADAQGKTVTGFVRAWIREMI